MASMPTMPRPFAGSPGSTAAGEPRSSESASLAAPVPKDSQSRRSTISIFSTPYTAFSGQEAPSPLLSPTPSNIALQTPTSPEIVKDVEDPTLAPPDKVRSSSFVSHFQHHESLKAANRPRSDSAASNSSGSGMGLPATRSGVAGAFGAVTNLVSNVRHAYSPSVSSQTSTAGTHAGPPIQRFLDCEADDLKMSEVALLLADYKRLAARLDESAS